MLGVGGQVVYKIRTPDGRVVVEIRGPEEAWPPVVCLHGLSANRTTWRPVAERVEGERRLILVDLLGRGASDPAPEARFDLASEVRRLRLVIDSLGVVRPVLAGHSHGAAICVAAAEEVRALGLLLVNPVTPDLSRPRILGALGRKPIRAAAGPAVRLFRRPLTRYMLERRVFADRGALPPGAVDRYSDPWGDPERAAGLPKILSDWDPAELEAWSGASAVPVRVVAGSEDRRIPPELARRWCGTLGGIFCLEQGCGHSAPEERTMAVASVLEDLMRTITEEWESLRHDQE